MSGDARVRLLGGACGGTRRPFLIPEFDLVVTFYVEGARDMADVQRLQREWLDRLTELVWAAMEEDGRDSLDDTLVEYVPVRPEGDAHAAAGGSVSALDRLARHCRERRLGFALYYDPDLATEGFRFEVRVHGEPRRGEPRFVEWGVTAFEAAAKALDRLIPTEESEGTDGSATAR